MSEELDDGEIPKDAHMAANNTRESTNNLTHLRNSRSPRQRTYERTYENERPSGVRPDVARNRSGYRSPYRDTTYSRRRSPSPRRSDRYPVDSVTRVSRAQGPGSRKEPSVHDANTRADLGRLAREAEAAAYKARTAQPTKTDPAKEIPKILSASSSEAKAPSGSSGSIPQIRKRSRSPSVHRSRDDRRSSPRRSLTPHPSSVPRSPLYTKPKPVVQLSKESSYESEHRKGLTAADLGRLQREKEAAAYKAKVLTDSKKPQQKVEPRAPTHTSTNGSKATVAPVESKRASEAVAKTTNVVVPPVKEVVKQVVSFTPKLDAERADLQAECQKLFVDHMKKQAEARIVIRKWATYEREVAREAYKSELAQQSLESTVTL